MLGEIKQYDFVLLFVVEVNNALVNFVAKREEKT